MKDLNYQYDEIADKFSAEIVEGNKDSRNAFVTMLPPTLKEKSVVDLGCGNGLEIESYLELNPLSVLGVDASRELLNKAREKYPELSFEYGLFDSIPVQEASIDYVFSKYAIQTAKDLEPVWIEINRVLKTGGVFVLLVAHPIRQFNEKKSQPKDYFEQKIVDSVCFDGAITFREPTHTMKEYLSQYMLDNFVLEGYEEKFDSAAEKIIDTYPGFLLLKWKKK